MSKLGSIVLNGEHLDVLVRQTYSNGRMAVEVRSFDGPFAMLSVNLPEAPTLEPYHFYAKTWSENAILRQPALDSGLFEDTGRRVRTGFVEAEVWRIVQAQVVLPVVTLKMSTDDLKLVRAGLAVAARISSGHTAEVLTAAERQLDTQLYFNEPVNKEARMNRAIERLAEELPNGKRPS